MDCYKNNLEALKKYDNRMHDRYLEWKKEQMNADISIKEEIARDGNKILVVEKNGVTYRLNSKYYPQKETEEWAKQFKLNNISQMVNLFGMGNLMFPMTLRKLAPESMILIVYEPSVEMFDYMMQTGDIAGLVMQKNTILLVGPINGDDLYGVLGTLLTWANVKDAISTHLPQYESIFPEEYQKHQSGVRDGEVRALKNSNTVAYFAKDMVKNNLCSLQMMKNAHMLFQYKEKIDKDVPAIVVAAGPSLDLNIEKLKMAQGKAIIIATDTAMRDLNKHNIRPDFMVTVDPRKPADYLEDERCRDIPLFCADISNRAILEHHRGPKIFIEISDSMKELFPMHIWDTVDLGRGGSVATAAFSLCVSLNLKTIIMVGQDLAYRNGVSHAGNRMSGEEMHGKFLVEVENIYGEKIMTRHEWYDFLRWFEDAIYVVGDKMKVIDATEGGAKIKGTEILTLEDAIAKYCKKSIDCAKIVSGIEPYFKTENADAIESFTAQLIADVKKNQREGSELILDLERLLSLGKRHQYDAEYKKLSKKLTKIGNDISQRPAYYMAEDWGSDIMYDGLFQVYHMEDSPEDELQTYQTAIEFYKKLVGASKEIEPLIQETYEKITRRV